VALRSKDFTIFDVAAGTGMFSAAVELACAAVGVRARTIGFCERDACAAACLVARMEGKTLHPAPIWDDVGTLDCEPWRGLVDCLCAGYPCQPFSTAGKRLGHRDPRHLWPKVRRAIARIEPRVVFLENVAGHVGKGAGKVLRDFQRIGYRVTAGLFSSRECGAPHARKRLFILATRVGLAHSGGKGLESLGYPKSRRNGSLVGDGERLADAECNRHKASALLDIVQELVYHRSDIRWLRAHLQERQLRAKMLETLTTGYSVNR
jgi:site-specific DNA-cytosine methylase